MKAASLLAWKLWPRLKFYKTLNYKTLNFKEKDGLGCFEDLCRYNNISVISRLESRRYPISKIQVTRQASQELNHLTTTGRNFNVKVMK